MVYILKAAITLTLLYSLYGICLRRESFHSLNRVVLILILAASVTLPLFHVETSLPTLFGWMDKLDPKAGSIELGTITAVPFQDEPAVASETSETVMPMFSWTQVLSIIYIIGVAFFACRYLLAIFRTIRTIRQSRPVEANGSSKRVLVNHNIGSSCSWLHWILLTPSDVNNPSIITHERAHVRLRHSYDKIFCEIIVRLLWFVPFGWMLREDLSDIHEYEADRSVIDAGFNIQDYCMLLIHRATHPNITPVVNAFNESKTKQRMARMFQPKSSRLSTLKALYLFPILAVAIVAVAGEKPKENGYDLYVNTPSEEAQPLLVVDGRIINTPVPDKQQITIQEYVALHNINPADISHITVLKGETGKAIWGAKGANGVIQIDTKNATKEDDPEHEVFLVAEEPAEFPGGREALMRYVSSNIHYPEIAQEYGVQGKVHVEFVVQKNGAITDVKATKLDPPSGGSDIIVTSFSPTQTGTSNGDEITKAKEILMASAVAMVRSMPNWKPARLRGHVVRMKVSLPITYRLQ